MWPNYEAYTECTVKQSTQPETDMQYEIRVKIRLQGARTGEPRLRLIVHG